MVTSDQVLRPSGVPAPVGPYSHAVRAGDFLFCSGQIPLNPNTGSLAGNSIEEQTEQVLQNIRAILHSDNLEFSDVLKVTVYLVDLAEFAQMNNIYTRYFVPEYPARTTVQVSALPRGARIEMEIIASYQRTRGA